MRERWFFLLALLASTGPTSTTSAEEACAEAVIPCCDLPTVAAPLREAAPAIGYQIWPSSLAAHPQATAALTALRPRYLRFSLGPNWRRQPALSAEMADAELDAYVARGHGSVVSDRAAFAILNQIQAETDAALLQIVWEPPPLPGDPDFTVAGAPTWRKLEPANIELMARFLVAELKFVAAAGVRLEGVELINEPDGSWNLKVRPGDYLTLIRAVRREAERRAVALPPLYGPGSGSVAALVAYLGDPASAAGIVDSVDMLSVHGWDDAKGADRIAELDRLYSLLARMKRRPKLAFTEFGVGRPVITDSSERMNSRKRVADSVAVTPSFAAATIRELTRVLGHGVGPVIYWEFQDQPWGRGLLGLLDTEGRTKPVYDAVERIVDALETQQVARVSASADGRIAVLHSRSGRDLLVAANAGAAPLDVLMRSRQAAGAAPKPATGCLLEGANGVGVAAESVVVAPLSAP
jgi:hypothetical protein